MGDLPFLTPVSEKDTRVETACSAVLKAFSIDAAPVGNVYVKPKGKSRALLSFKPHCWV